MAIDKHSSCLSLGLVLGAALWSTSCGGSSNSQASAPSSRPSDSLSVPDTSGTRPTGGSSDGITCEEAQEGNVDEVAIGTESQPDLSPKQFEKVLNDGAYLDACGVSHDTKVSVCAAVKNGAAVGVTIATLPSDPELEKCIAEKVRALSFPVHPKMDVVKTDF